ncbi:MAG: translation initiation factor IF-2 [Acidobacteriota bacterium]
MEQVKVSELASEFEIRNSTVIGELKRIGVWVPSADTQVDQDIANRVRRRLQLLAEIEQEEQSRAVKAKVKKKAPAPAKPRKRIAPMGRPSKGVRRKPSEEDEALADSPLAGSLAPRKGKASVYRRVERPAEAEEAVEEAAAAPVEEVVEAPAATVPEAAPEPAAADEKKEPEVAAQAEVAEPAAQEAPPVAATPVEPAKPRPAVIRPAPAAKPAPAPVQRPARRKPPARRPALVRPAARQRVRPGMLDRKRMPLIVQPAPPKDRKGPKVRELVPQDLTLSETLSLKEFSEKISVKSKDVLRELITMGIMGNINMLLDQAIMEKLCQRFKVTPNFVTYEESVIEESQAEDEPEDLKPRPPVITVMGHVDHGKTSLLDSIRNTQVAASEAGGITQRIGAYHVDVNGQRIVFLDTPGHEAFTQMRSRGAQATDLVVLVVAADDGVMPQTREAIDHAKAAGVPILVAINKIDKPDAQPDKVRQELSELELIPEDWGGDTIMVEVSATKQTNLDPLMEMILLVAEVLELKANPDRPASGLVLEAKIDKGRGSVATVLVRNGTLNIGDHFIAGSASGKIRAMFDDQGNPCPHSGPGSAVEILGLQSLPQAGDFFQGVQDAAMARQVVEYRKRLAAEQERHRPARMSLEDLYARMKAGEVRELPVVVKGDTRGSVEVVTEMLHKIKSEKVKVRILHKAVGAISESDVLLASASAAIVIGFNVRPEKSAQAAADKEGVDIRLYTVIYKITEEIEKALVGLLEPAIQEVFQGRAEIRETFKVPRYGIAAGSYIQEGTVERSSRIRLLRDNVVIYEGKIDSLRRFKEDVSSVRSGYECGISIAGYQDIKPGDIIEAYTLVETTPELH